MATGELFAQFFMFKSQCKFPKIAYNRNNLPKNYSEALSCPRSDNYLDIAQSNFGFFVKMMAIFWRKSSWFFPQRNTINCIWIFDRCYHRCNEDLKSLMNYHATHKWIIMKLQEWRVSVKIDFQVWNVWNFD